MLGSMPKLAAMALPTATMLLDTRIFDTLVSRARRLEQSLALQPCRTLTPARILVLTALSLSPSRKAIRDAARALRTSSRFGANLQRVHVHSRLCVILRDLHDMGLVRARRGRRRGWRRYALAAGVHQCMQQFLQEATHDAARAA